MTDDDFDDVIRVHLRGTFTCVRAAATFLHDRPGSLPEGAVPTDVTRLAVLAIEVHGAFLRRDEETQQTTVVDPDPEALRAAVVCVKGQAPTPASW